MGKDSWNLMYGKLHSPVTRKGTRVDMHPDEGYGGQMIPGYAGAYQNEKTKVLGKKSLKANGNPKTYGSQKPRKGNVSAQESFTSPQPPPKKRK